MSHHPKGCGLRLGRRQLELLAAMASPFSLLVAGDAVTRSLEKRGLVAPHFAKSKDGFFGVTPRGLRALADEMERGRLEQFIDQKYERSPARIYMSARDKQ